ncbi:hypothetical protein MML48_10g00000202 [Holotrichia oblita]|uniref:Uncharacterized protein n=1 Tax=Holotrichia oblita TaxID=644536 RepID=A0ACB9SHR7_HOLOL|nr:hypothetical protein MML48_10g00000202 [Holotrichia oblita]
MDLNNNERTSKKRRRNTTDEQYEIYLFEMEQDYNFRSGTINPTMDENYLKNKWEILSTKLNSVANGPQLSVAEWKKRFKDWKNSTRAKYRKLCDSQKETGGGPPSKIILGDLEERGLAVWGKAAVTGSSVTEEGGLQILSIRIPELEPSSSMNEGNLESTTKENIFDNDVQYITVEETAGTSVDECVAHYTTVTPQNKNLIKTPRKDTPLKEVARNLLQSYNTGVENNLSIGTSISTFIKNYEDIQTKKLKLKEERNNIEKQKLKFEIAKVKFLNPDFKFDI